MERGVYLQAVNISTLCFGMLWPQITRWKKLKSLYWHIMYFKSFLWEPGGADLSVTCPIQGRKVSIGKGFGSTNQISLSVSISKIHWFCSLHVGEGLSTFYLWLWVPDVGLHTFEDWRKILGERTRSQWQMVSKSHMIFRVTTFYALHFRTFSSI